MPRVSPAILADSFVTIRDVSMPKPSSTPAPLPDDRLTHWGRSGLVLVAIGCVAYTSFGLYLTLLWPHDGPGTLFSLLTLTCTWLVAVGTSFLIWFGRWRLPTLIALCLPLLMFMLWCAAWPVTPQEFTQIR